MSTAKNIRPAFPDLELDPIDELLEAKAAEKGISTIITPKPETQALPAPPVPAAAIPPQPALHTPPQPKPQQRRITAKIDLPDYVWIELKKAAAERMVTLRHLIMSCLRMQGFSIKDEDMIEDGRRLR